METMKENKGKKIVSRDEVVYPEEAVPVVVCPNALRTLKLMPSSSLEKKKTVSKTIDKMNLPTSKKLMHLSLSHPM